MPRKRVKQKKIPTKRWGVNKVMRVERRPKVGEPYTEFRQAYFVEVLRDGDWLKLRRYACSSVSEEDAIRKAQAATDANRQAVEEYWQQQRGERKVALKPAPPKLETEMTLKQAALQQLRVSRRWRDGRQIHLSPSYVRRIENYIRKLDVEGFGTRPLKSLRSVELSEWFNTQCETCAARTAKNLRGWLVGVGEFALNNEYWPRNLFKLIPKVGIDTTRKMRVLSLDEIDALWEAARTPSEKACLVLLRLGLRQGEVLALSDLDFVDDCTVMVNNTLTERPNPAYKPGRDVPKTQNYLGHTKTVRSRSPIHVPLAWMKILQDALAVAKPCAIPDHEGKNGEIRFRRFVISNRFGALWDEWSASRGMRKLIERAGITMEAGEQTWHCWRHSYASDLVALGIDDIALGRLLRHADPTLTRGTYSHARDAYRHRYAEFGADIRDLNGYNEALCRFDTERRLRKQNGTWSRDSI